MSAATIAGQVGVSSSILAKPRNFRAAFQRSVSVSIMLRQDFAISYGKSSRSFGYIFQKTGIIEE